MRASRIVAAFVAAIALVAGMGGQVPAAVAAEAPAAIRGQVLAFMDPVGYARVTVLNAATGAKVASVVTDGSGYYMVTGLPAIAVKVRATKPGYLDSWADGASSSATATVYTLVSGQTLEQSWDPMRLYLDLTPEGVVTGSVIGLASPSSPGPGRTLRGARVVVVSAATGKTLGSARTSSAGAFRIGMLPAGEVTVKVSAGGFGTASAPNNPPGEVVRFPVQAGATTDIGTIRLYSRATVYGYILWQMDPIPEPAEVTVFAARTGAVLRRVAVPPFGQFRLDGLRPGRISVRVRASGYLDAWWGPVTVRPGQVFGPAWSSGAAVFQLTREAVVTGTVMGIDDNPLAGWDGPLGGVVVKVVSHTTGKVLGRAVTDSLGAFRVGGLPQGEVQVKAIAPAWSAATWAPDQPSRASGAVFGLTSGETVDVGTVRVFAPAAVTGTVLSGTHRLPGARVTVFDALTRKPIASTLTGAHGRYRIGGLWTGESRQVKVRAARIGYHTTWADSAPGSSWATATVFTLSPGVTLAGSVSPPVLILRLARPSLEP